MMPHVAGPGGPLSGAPVWPQLSVDEDENGVFGSSMSSSASLYTFTAVTLLVRFVLRNSEKFTCGTGKPASVGIPPVQTRTRSPTDSVRPSARTTGATATLALHTNG